MNAKEECPVSMERAVYSALAACAQEHQTKLQAVDGRLESSRVAEPMRCQISSALQATQPLTGVADD